MIKKKIKDLKRPALLDCTLRDGGLVNDSNFDDDFALDAFDACVCAHIDIVEIGYKDSPALFPSSKFGKYRHCRDADMFEVFGDNLKNVLVSELADAGKCDWKDFVCAEKSPTDIIRCAFYEEQKFAAVDIINSCADKGYQTALCMMAASTLSDAQIENALALFTKSQADCIYLMDSFGGLIPTQVRRLSKIYADAAHAAGKMFGIHCHNNLQCAFANTIEAIECGADIADCSLAGFGKGSGNCPTELIAGKFRDRYDLRKILQVVENRLVPLRAKYRWGFDYPYLISGFNNQHPREAMDFEKRIANGEKLSILNFSDTNNIL